LEPPSHEEPATEHFTLPGDPTATFRLPDSGEPPSAAAKPPDPEKPTDKPEKCDKAAKSDCGGQVRQSY
jgi:hypothetical protein